MNNEEYFVALDKYIVSLQVLRAEGITLLSSALYITALAVVK